jgi:hypothetical protein
VFKCCLLFSQGEVSVGEESLVGLLGADTAASIKDLCVSSDKEHKIHVTICWGVGVSTVGLANIRPHKVVPYPRPSHCITRLPSAVLIVTVSHGTLIFLGQHLSNHTLGIISTPQL